MPRICKLGLWFAYRDHELFGIFALGDLTDLMDRPPTRHTLTRLNSTPIFRGEQINVHIAVHHLPLRASEFALSQFQESEGNVTALDAALWCISTPNVVFVFHSIIDRPFLVCLLLLSPCPFVSTHSSNLASNLGSNFPSPRPLSPIIGSQPFLHSH